MKRDYSLDFAKIFAMFLVAWGHFVGVGTNETNNVSGIINGNEALPLLPKAEQLMWKVDNFLYSSLSAQTAAVGVIIFFIISGIFIPIAQEKYCKEEFSKFHLFAQNRVFPTLFWATMFIVVMEKYLQGISFSTKTILTTLTGVPSMFSSVPVMGVIWFLTVLEFMWFVSCLIPKYTIQKVLLLDFMCFILVMIPNYMPKDFEYLGLLRKLLTGNVRMIGIILIGVIWHLTKSYRVIDRIIFLGLQTVLCTLILHSYELTYNHKETYDNINSYLVAFVIIFVAKFIYNFVSKKLTNEKSKEKFIQAIEFLASLFLPFYLIHVAMGLNVIFFLRKCNTSPYICVLMAYLVSGLSAVCINKIVAISQNIIKLNIDKLNHLLNSKKI